MSTVVFSFSSRFLLSPFLRRGQNSHFWRVKNTRTFSDSVIGSDNVVRSKFTVEIPPEETNFDFTWKQSVQKYPDRICLTDGVTERAFTFKEGHERSRSVAVALIKRLGLKKDEVCALFLPTCTDYPFIFSGANLAGIIPTTINPIYLPTEVGRQLQMSRSKVVFTLSALIPVVKEAMEKGGKMVEQIVAVDAPKHVGENVLSLEELLSEMKNESAEFPRINPKEDIAVLPYSSGTTGPPKGCMLTHRNMVASARQIVYAKDWQFIPFPTDTFQPTTICILPFFHIFGMNVTLFPILHVGGHVVTLPKFEPDIFIGCLEKHKPDFLHLVPPLVGFCANHPAVKPGHFDTVEYVMVGAAPVGQALIDKFHQKAPKVLFREGYGMTELSPVALFTPKHDVIHCSAGQPVPNTELKVVDIQTGEALGSGQRGEICVKGDIVMKGYMDNEKATKETIAEDGWLHTGDIGYFDEGGHFFLVDRLKELIKVKGFQVPPAELEDLLLSHPDVADVAVIGVPDERLGEAPRAYIVLKGEKTTEDDLKRFVAENVSEYKRLAGGVEIVDVIPKSASGKILRKDILADYKQKFSS